MAEFIKRDEALLRLGKWETISLCNKENISIEPSIELLRSKYNIVSIVCNSKDTKKIDIIRNGPFKVYLYRYPNNIINYKVIPTMSTVVDDIIATNGWIDLDRDISIAYDYEKHKAYINENNKEIEKDIYCISDSVTGSLLHVYNGKHNYLKEGIYPYDRCASISYEHGKDIRVVRLSMDKDLFPNSYIEMALYGEYRIEWEIHEDLEHFCVVEKTRTIKSSNEELISRL